MTRQMLHCWLHDVRPRGGVKVSRLRKGRIPAGGTSIALVALVIIISGTAWGATGAGDLAGGLRGLALQAAQGTAPAGAGEVLVAVHFKSAMAAAANRLAGHGARVRFRNEERVEAFVPANRLLEIASLPEVAMVRPPSMVVPAQAFGAHQTEALQVVGATAFHRAGYTGRGIRVAVIDTGFGQLSGAEVPATAETISFRADGTMGTSDHGTQVAEIIADFAPSADFTLIAVDTDQALITAADYVANQGFDVVNASVGLPIPPYDGTAAVARAINRARDAGVFWVNAAGNNAKSHWQGTWQDRDRDGLLEFGAGDESIEVRLGPWGSYLGSGLYEFHLSWFESAGALTDRDYDLVLRDSSGTLIAQSRWTQNGDDPPYDVLSARIDTDDIFSLEVVHVSGPTDPLDRFQLFAPGVEFEQSHQVAVSSLDTLATARGAYAVGAVRGPVMDIPGFPILAMDQLEEFSSQGPILGQPLSVKPDLVAPDGVTTSFTDTNVPPFMGTSASAAHVAGAAALLLSEDQLRTADEIETLLRQQAVRLGDPIPNNRFGWGRLDMRVGADARPPTITIAYPQTGTTITTRTPTIIAFISDQGSGVDPTTIIVELNGEVIFDGSQVARIEDFFDARTGQFSLRLDQTLARTNHTVLIRASDVGGNEADPAVTNFRVAAPTIVAGVSMVSFPYRDLAVTDPSVILGMPLSELALVRWWPLDTTVDKYHFYPDARASLVPPDCQQANLEDRTVPYPPAGLGYFLSIPRPAVLDIQGQPLQDVPSTHIRLYRGQSAPRGWNLIGNPFDEQLGWGTVQFETNGQRLDLREAIAEGITEGVLFEYVQGSGGRPGFYDFNPDPAAAIMQPRKGYWLHVNEETRARIYSTGVGISATTDGAGSEPQVEDGWTLTLQARAGEYQDPRNIIGVKSTASAGYDPQWDIPKPPPIVEGLQMSMSGAAWGDNAGRYARDIRGISESSVWDVEVACALPDTEVEVSWPQMNAEVPGDVRLVLEDLETGRKVYMRTSNGYRFRTGADGAIRHLRVSTAGGGQTLAVQSMSAQSTAGAVMITYSLAAPAEVSVEIINIAGRLIRQYAAREVDGGTQETLSWNGVSDRGSAVPSGRYIVRLTALGADGQTVQAIRPFSITR